MTIISIHQPVYLPWLGFFDKIIQSDKFVLLDDVQYEKNGFQNRNKIRTYDGDMWLTVPVKAKSQTLLNEVSIDNSGNWSNKHIKSVFYNYSKTKYFENYWNDIKKILEKKFDYLIDLNKELIDYFIEKLNIKTDITLASELDISGKGSDRILNICKSLNADEYFSGIGGKNYLEIQNFKRSEINLVFQNFKHPTYHQVEKPFYPNMAIVDLLFNEGINAEKIMKRLRN